MKILNSSISNIIYYNDRSRLELVWEEKVKRFVLKFHDGEGTFPTCKDSCFVQSCDRTFGMMLSFMLSFGA